MKYLTFLITVIVVLLSFNIGRADVRVSSSYGMALSSDEVKTLFEQIRFEGAESHAIQDFVIEQPFRTQLQNISLSGNYDAGLKPGVSLLEFALTAKMSSLVLRVGKISTDAVINKTVGGVNVQVFLKGFCENVEIRSISDSQMTARVNVATGTQGLVPAVSSIDVGTLSQWSINMGQCQGPLGYDKALSAEIRNLLTDKTEIQKLVTNPILIKLQSVAQSLNAKIFAPHSMDLANYARVQFLPEELQLMGPNGPFMVSGKVTAHLKASEDKAYIVEDSAFAQKISVQKGTGIYLSQKWIMQSIQKAQSLKLLNHSFSSSSISSLKSLFSNRLFQFFLWPDLMNFARNVLFMFEMRLQSLDKFSVIGASDGALWYDFQGSGSVFTQAPKKSAYFHYGDFKSSLKSRVWVKMHKGAAVVGAYDPKFQLNFSWAKKYLSLFNPFKSISVSYFASKIQSTLKNEKYSFVVPKLQVSDSTTMVSDAISGDADVLFLSYTAK